VKSFRTSLALRLALGGFALFVAVGIASVFALRSILSDQLDGTLLHLAEVEAQAGAAAAGPEFVFHEGVLLAAGEGTTAELIRYAQLWTNESRPAARSKNLSTDLELPPDAFAEGLAGRIGWATHTWQGRRMRSVIYPLALVGSAHHVHLLQVAAPIEPLRQTLLRFSVFLAVLMLLATAGAFAVGDRISRVALRPTGEITAQAEAITAGTLSERITAHADVEEFTRLVNVLNGMLDRLGRAFDLQRQFTADASHELRGPLTVLKGDIDVTLKRERTGPEYRETLERCREEVDRLSRLAGDLLVLARSDAALPLEHVSEVDLREILDRVRGRFRAVAEERGVRLDARGPSVMVSGDPALLERIVSNLLDNAVKHCRPGGAVEAKVVADREAVLTVRDEGPGISAEHVPRLFDRFFRADPARQRGTGSGLGLAIARAGAEAHGGRLEFAGNAPGAVFRLTLPLDASGS
jgi:two-component system OmpR family sensor kinase